MTEYDAEMVKRLAGLSALAYEDEAHIKCSIGSCESFDEADTQAVLTRSDEFDLLAFRGTEPTNWNDWKTDLKIVREKYQFGSLRSGKIHRGFKNAIDHVRDRIDEARQTDPDRRIYVTGHSLGGALAVLWAASQSEHPKRIAGVYTFGAPRVGTSAFARCYDELFKERTFQFQNRLDMVPKVPNRYFWRHVGHALYFDADGTLHWNPSYWFCKFVDARANYQKRNVSPKAWVGDHSMKEYRERVETL